MMNPTEELQNWTAIRGRGWNSILVGNGASLALWPEFGYQSLVQQAALSSSDHRLFKSLDTTNFESVLDALRVARLVCSQSGHRSSDVQERYREIRRALIDAVRDVHVPWNLIPTRSLREVRSALRDFSYVYTTNYDLLIYWSIMVENARGFRDFFWSPDKTFDIANTSTSSNLTKVLYLHGALHLYRTSDGATAKRTAVVESLLDAISRPDAEIPLFVSEGRSEDKLNAIRRSDYLSFSSQVFGQDSSSLVVFGHSLSSQDEHLRSAVNQSKRRVAISMLPGRDAAVRRRKAELIDLFPQANLSFFDATTHPLGAPGLRIHP